MVLAPARRPPVAHVEHADEHGAGPVAGGGRRRQLVLLDRAQEAGAVRADVRTDEVMALLLACTQGAVHGRWTPDLRERTLQLIFTGLR
ncbi:hypothetical protein WEH80_05625 [Actinomycetes bacterium KLBMP 9759]